VAKTADDNLKELLLRAQEGKYSSIPVIAAKRLVG
jgi:hypothetical protein